MGMRPLMIGPKQKAGIMRVIKFAESNRIPIDALKKVVADPKAPAVGDQKERVILLPIGFRVVFSIEEQPAPLGWSRHVSISVSRRGRFPHEAAVALILHEFGFNPGPRITYLEEGRSVNVIQSMAAGVA